MNKQDQYNKDNLRQQGPNKKGEDRFEKRGSEKTSEQERKSTESKERERKEQGFRANPNQKGGQPLHGDRK